MRLCQSTRNEYDFRAAIEVYEDDDAFSAAWRIGVRLMLSREENDLLTRTGPGTPMGQAMRRYWVPALISWELPAPDCPPVRVKLLGEALVAFRDTEGRIGLLDEFCAHRGTSLWLGRNEHSGLRCIWHGWKYDVTGQCVHQLNETEETSFAHKTRI